MIPKARPKALESLEFAYWWIVGSAVWRMLPYSLLTSKKDLVLKARRPLLVLPIVALFAN